MKGFSVPPLTRILVITFVVLSIGVAVIRFSSYGEFPEGSEDNVPMDQIYVPFLTLTPSWLFLFPWTVITSAFVEESVVGFFITGATLLFCGRYCERIWGGKALGIFILLQATMTNVLTAITLHIIGLLSRHGELTASRINGGIPFQLGFLVALKQLVPEHSVVLFQGVVKVQVKYLVMPVLLLYTLLGVVEGLATFYMAWYAFLTAWIYLRFVKVVYIEALPTSLTENSSQQKVRGDASDAFALERFFYPELVSRAVKFVSDPIYTLLVKIKVVRPFNQEEIDAGNDQASLRTQGFLNDNQQRMAQAISDRRRNMALKALEERMQS